MIRIIALGFCQVWQPKQFSVEVEISLGRCGRTVGAGVVSKIHQKTLRSVDAEARDADVVGLV